MRGVVGIALLAVLALSVSPAHGADLRIDGSRSHAEFGVRLLWLSTVSGRFAQISGEVRLDAREHATVDAHIPVASLTMDSARFRRDVLAPPFFDAANYPLIHFLSDPIPLARLTAGGALDGQLSLRGVTLPVRFELLPSQCNTLTARGCLIQARGLISRRAFGMTSYRATVSDQVHLGLLIALDPASD
jgi:polyisoprenoid-binding protein YceI